MDDSEATSLEQIEAFLAGSGGVRFAGQKRDEVYAWTERTLARHQYSGLSKREKGLLRRYVSQMTGLRGCLKSISQARDDSASAVWLRSPAWSLKSARDTRSLY
jgi:hypothetical protein